MKTETKAQKMIEMLTKKAETMLYDDYRVHLGMEREVSAKKWEKGEKSRTYIAIKCYSLGTRNYKGEYKCGYVDNLTGEYIVTKYDDFNLAEEMSEDEKTAFEALENAEKTVEEVAEEKAEKEEKKYYVLGGEFEPHCYGGADTIKAAKELSREVAELWFNERLIHYPPVYRASDTEEIVASGFITVPDGTKVRVPKEGAKPVVSGEFERY